MTLLTAGSYPPANNPRVGDEHPATCRVFNANSPKLFALPVVENVKKSIENVRKFIKSKEIKSKCKEINRKFKEINRNSKEINRNCIRIHTKSKEINRKCKDIIRKRKENVRKSIGKVMVLRRRMTLWPGNLTAEGPRPYVHPP